MSNEGARFEAKVTVMFAEPILSSAISSHFIRDLIGWVGDTYGAAVHLDDIEWTPTPIMHWSDYPGDE